MPNTGVAGSRQRVKCPGNLEQPHRHNVEAMKDFHVDEKYRPKYFVRKMAVI